MYDMDPGIIFALLTKTPIEVSVAVVAGIIALTLTGLYNLIKKKLDRFSNQ